MLFRSGYQGVKSQFQIQAGIQERGENDIPVVLVPAHKNVCSDSRGSSCVCLDVSADSSALELHNIPDLSVAVCGVCVDYPARSIRHELNLFDLAFHDYRTAAACTPKREPYAAYEICPGNIHGFACCSVSDCRPIFYDGSLPVAHFRHVLLRA